MDESKESHPHIRSMGSETKEPDEKYGTIADQRDMYRMGKTQKLRVRYDSTMATLADYCVAKLWILQYLRLFVRVYPQGTYTSLTIASMILLSTWETQLG
jgi:hypothetical protein